MPDFKTHISSYLFFPWVDKSCIQKILKCGLKDPHNESQQEARQEACLSDTYLGISLNKSTQKNFYFIFKLDDF